jgi:predicted ABC-type ATPase
MKTSTAKEMIFTMGLPGAGKSTVVAARYRATHTIIDSDRILEGHPAYDPENPAPLYPWAAARAEAAFDDALAQGDGRYLVDSTGTHAERVIGQMKRAKAKGFSVRLVYVRCSLETSLARNSRRARKVPEPVIREKAAVIAASFARVSPCADEVHVIDNDATTEAVCTTAAGRTP